MVVQIVVLSFFGKNFSSAGGESASCELSDAHQTLSAFIADRVMVFPTKKLPVVD
jgi:hypothetical protein